MSLGQMFFSLKEKYSHHEKTNPGTLTIEMKLPESMESKLSSKLLAHPFMWKGVVSRRFVNNFAAFQSLPV